MKKNAEIKEVFFNTEDIKKINNGLINWLKQQALDSPNKKARFCLHKNTRDSLHEMIIVFVDGVYVRPHRHPDKIESFHIIEGKLLVIIFDTAGNISDTFTLDKKSRNNYFMFRIEKNYWHTVVPMTNFVVFHEITNGPFIGTGGSEYPDWAPGINDREKIIEFFNFLDIKKKFPKKKK